MWFRLRLTASLSEGGRSPTEAQWEYACRAESTTRFYFGDDPEYDQLDKYAWYAGNSSDKTHAVGTKLPNRWDLYDMHGNVWEWCMDWYGEYKGVSTSDPRGADSGEYRVLRGAVGISMVLIAEPLTAIGPFLMARSV